MSIARVRFDQHQASELQAGSSTTNRTLNPWIDSADRLLDYGQSTLFFLVIVVSHSEAHCSRAPMDVFGTHRRGSLGTYWRHTL